MRTFMSVQESDQTSLGEMLVTSLTQPIVECRRIAFNQLFTMTIKPSSRIKCDISRQSLKRGQTLSILKLFLLGTSLCQAGIGAQLVIRIPLTPFLGGERGGRQGGEGVVGGQLLFGVLFSGPPYHDGCGAERQRPAMTALVLSRNDSMLCLL